MGRDDQLYSFLCVKSMNKTFGDHIYAHLSHRLGERSKEAGLEEERPWGPWETVTTREKVNTTKPWEACDFCLTLLPSHLEFPRILGRRGCGKKNELVLWGSAVLGESHSEKASHEKWQPSYWQEEPERVVSSWHRYLWEEDWVQSGEQKGSSSSRHWSRSWGAWKGQWLYVRQSPCPIPQNSQRKWLPRGLQAASLRIRWNSEGGPEDILDSILEKQEGVQNVKIWCTVVNVVSFYYPKVP